MDTAARILLMTRPAAQSRRFVESCESRLGRTVTSLIAPVIEIAARPLTVDLSQFQALVFTSENAVQALGSRAGAGELTAYCVGSRTAAAAEAAGYTAVSAEGNADDLVRLVQASRPRGRLLHLRGAHSAGYVAPRLRALGLRVEDMIAYDQIAQEISDAAIGILSPGGPPAIAPLFSPRSAALLRDATAEVSADLIPIAISRQAAEAWRDAARAPEISARPTSAAMLDAVLDALCRDSAC